MFVVGPSLVLCGIVVTVAPVLAGWAVGSATGALVALMHPMEPVTTDGTGSTSQAFVTWSGAF